MVTSRIWFTPEQKTELWDRWKQGHSISAISRALERRNKTGVQRIVALHGGIAPLPRHHLLSLHRRYVLAFRHLMADAVRGQFNWSGRFGTASQGDDAND